MALFRGHVFRTDKKWDNESKGISDRWSAYGCGRLWRQSVSVRADDLAAHVLRALMERHPGLDPGKIDDVLMGCANQAGEDNRNVARMASLLAGLPWSVPGETINRLCASGMSAVAQSRRAILAGEAISSWLVEWSR